MSDNTNPKKTILEQLKLDSFWDNMSPNQRRGAVVVGGVAGLFLVMGLIVVDDRVSANNVRDSVKRSVLSDMNTRSIGIDALNAKVKTVVSENNELHKQLDLVQNELTEMKRRRGNDPDMSKQIASLQNRLQSLTDTAKTLGWDVADIKESHYSAPAKTDTATESESKETEVKTQPVLPEKTVVPLAIGKENIETPPPADLAAFENKTTDFEEKLHGDPGYYFRTAPVRPSAPAPMAGAPDLKTGAQPGGGLTIFTMESEAQTKEETTPNAEFFLPAGSIISGVLLNGLDAATGRGARKDPFPVLVRIQQDAILPNLFNADVKECFATLAGYGELSSERAYLRGETFSCITKNGEVMEETLPSYAVGEDGKAGIRGRLVSKAGSLIAKTALAGFAAGVAEAFGSSPVPVLQTGNVGNGKAYQDNFSSSTARHGASSGASAALTRLSDYYMDMADQIFPVVEVDAGRQIDIVLTAGFKLNIKNLKSIKLAKKD